MTTARQQAPNVCDFCHEPDPKWSYPASDFHAGWMQGSHGWVEQVSVGSWAACTPCAELVDAGDERRLVERSLDGYMRRHPHHAKSAARRSFRDLIARFSSHRTGPRIPILEDTDPHRQPCGRCGSWRSLHHTGPHPSTGEPGDWWWCDDCYDFLRTP